MVWNEVWKLLDAQSAESVLKPLILDAWHHSSNAEKKTRFEHHVNLAIELDLLNEALEIIGVSEDNWHHEHE